MGEASTSAPITPAPTTAAPTLAPTKAPTPAATEASTSAPITPAPTTAAPTTTTSTAAPVKTALVSVFDKTGLDELGKFLAQQGVHILSTGGTAAKLRELGCTVQDIAPQSSRWLAGCTWKR